RRARATARRRREVRAVLTVVTAGLLVMSVLQRDGRLVAPAALVGLAAWAPRPDPDADRWRRAAAGEMATAVLLGRLPRRWVVLHDRAVPGSVANIDHLVIGPTGVWVVDTKAARPRLRVSRGQVWAGDHAIDRGPAAWQAEVVSDRLGVGAGGVVAVHGAGLRGRGE